MTSTFFPPIQTWRLPERAFQDSLMEMARDGADGNEGVVLWLGQCAQGQADITHLVGLRGPGVIKRPNLLVIEAWLLNEVTDVALEHHVQLIGQIHSHGTGYSTDLSLVDRAHGIAVPHYLSIVAPDYGLRSGTRISDCGVHIFEPGPGYCRLQSDEVEQRIKVISGPALPLLFVGQNEED